MVSKLFLLNINNSEYVVLYQASIHQMLLNIRGVYICETIVQLMHGGKYYVLFWYSLSANGIPVMTTLALWRHNDNP